MIENEANIAGGKLNLFEKIITVNHRSEWEGLDRDVGPQD